MILSHINQILSGAIIPMMLTATGLFYCVKLRAFHIFKPFCVIKGMKSQTTSGGISSWKAVTLALAGTLGVGNIVGVSSAIHLGGFGAVFWMWISALLAMLLKYAEIVLAMLHRKINKDGSPQGSAMYYILDFFNSAGLRRIGRTVAYIFSAAFMFNSLTMGSLLQVNAISEAMNGVLGISPVFVGAIIALLTFLTVRKGTKSIAALTNVLVPLISLGYVIMSMAVIICNGAEVGNALRLILSSAFSRNAAVSGVGGYVFTRSLRYGVMRGLISNEAGCGTAPTAHSVADCGIPSRQGMWGIFEVFADTIVLCTMTALCVILEYGEASRFGGNYMMMTLSAYSARFGDFAKYFLCVAVLCFGFATVVCWAHYGIVCVKFFHDTPFFVGLFTVIYCLCTFCGSFVSADIAWELADLSMGIMTVINLAVITMMWKEVKKNSLL